MTIPTQKTDPDLSALRAICNGYIAFLESPSYNEDEARDFKQYIFEAALDAFYGKRSVGICEQETKMNEYFHYHYNNDAPRIDVKLERNSRSLNYELKVSGAKTPEEARQLLRATLDLVKEEIAKENANG